MKTILGLVRPESGEMFIEGESVLGGQSTAMSSDAYAPDSAFQDNLTARELIAMIRDIRENPPGSRERNYAPCSTSHPHLGKQLKTLSGGTRQKSTRVLAFMFNPANSYAGRPTAGLDPIAASTFKDLVLAEREMGRMVADLAHYEQKYTNSPYDYLFDWKATGIFRAKAELPLTLAKNLVRTSNPARLLPKKNPELKNLKTQHFSA